MGDGAGSDEASPAAQPPRRGLFRRIAGTKRRRRIIGLLFIVVLVLFLKPGGQRWSAAESMSYLDCSSPAACRYPPSQIIDSLSSGLRFKMHINALGFRGPDISIPRPTPSTLRVQVFGDGNVFGNGVGDADTLPAALQDILQKQFPERRIEVQNFALPANYTVSNLRIYETFGRQFQPDIVIFASPRATARDLNWRINEVKTSPLFRWLVKTPTGRWLVNYWQSKSDLSGTDGGEEIRQRLSALALDQETRGTRVYFFLFYEEWFPDFMRRLPECAAWTSSTQGPSPHSGILGFITSHIPPCRSFSEHVPPELHYGLIKSGLLREEYRKTPLALPGDAKPSAIGHRHFARLIADTLIRDLASPTQ